MTMGPYQATGSFNGSPEIRKNRGASMIETIEFMINRKPVRLKAVACNELNRITDECGL
jgi:hypothetical protein